MQEQTHTDDSRTSLSLEWDPSKHVPTLLSNGWISATLTLTTPEICFKDVHLDQSINVFWLKMFSIKRIFFFSKTLESSLSNLELSKLTHQNWIFLIHNPSWQSYTKACSCRMKKKEIYYKILRNVFKITLCLTKKQNHQPTKKPVCVYYFSKQNFNKYSKIKQWIRNMPSMQ